MKLTPISGRVIVSPEDVASMTDSGLWLPQSYRKPSQRGVVVSVGRDVTVVEPGDRVVFDQFAGTTVKYQMQRPVVVLNAYDVLALLED